MGDVLRQSRPDDFVQSVGRALRVLEVVSAQPGLPVKAIARRCELNLSTTYHLVRTLAYEGYLERMADGTYAAGAEVAQRFYDVLGALGRPHPSRQVLRHLVARTGFSAYLGRFSAGRVVVADYVEGPGSPYLEDFERGLAVSAHATALGKVLLAALPRRERRAHLLAHGMRPFTANTRTDMAELDAELQALSRDAVVVEHCEFREGVSCAAGLVPANAPVWALVLSVRGEDVPRQAQRELLLAAADLPAFGSGTA
jgi:DNA-binding IclR family transcriptional regulator